MKPLDWSALRFEHIGTLDIGIVEYAGMAWVPLAHLANTLDVSVKRLRGAAENPRNHGRVILASVNTTSGGSPLVSVLLPSLLFLAPRLRASTNNRILRLQGHIDEIVGLQVIDVLAKKSAANLRSKVNKRLVEAGREKTKSAMVDAYFERKKGKPLAEVQANFSKETGLHGSTVNRFFNGSYLSKAAFAAHAEVLRREGWFTPQQAPRGRPATLTLFDMSQIKRRIKAGETTESVAERYNVSPLTVRSIAHDVYSTKAAEQERALSANPSPPGI